MEEALRAAAQWEAENAGLRRENDYLRQQRDILKKLWAFFSTNIERMLAHELNVDWKAYDHAVLSL